METVMKLPIQDRRYFIQKHNDEQNGIRSAYEKSKGGRVVEGDAINTYAKLEQENLKNMRGG